MQAALEKWQDQENYFPHFLKLTAGHYQQPVQFSVLNHFISLSNAHSNNIITSGIVCQTLVRVTLLEGQPFLTGTRP
jgi:hypothetical protein